MLSSKFHPIATREEYDKVSLICRIFRCKYEARHKVEEESGIFGSARLAPSLWKAKIARILETRAKGSYLDYGGKDRVG